MVNSSSDPSQERFQAITKRCPLGSFYTAKRESQARKKMRDPQPFKRVPDEVVLLIFSFLSLKELCGLLPLVDRRFRRLAYDRSLWRDEILNGSTYLAQIVHPKENSPRREARHLSINNIWALIKLHVDSLSTRTLARYSFTTVELSRSEILGLGLRQYVVRLWEGEVRRNTDNGICSTPHSSLFSEESFELFWNALRMSEEVHGLNFNGEINHTHLDFLLRGGSAGNLKFTDIAFDFVPGFDHSRSMKAISWLANMPFLERINLKSCLIGNRENKLLAVILPNIEGLERLDLGYTIFTGKDQMILFAETLIKLRRLKHFGIHGFLPSLMPHILDALACSEWESFTLQVGNGGEIPLAQTKRLADIIEKHPRLKALDLKNNYVSEEAAKVLEKAFSLRQDIVVSISCNLHQVQAQQKKWKKKLRILST